LTLEDNTDRLFRKLGN